MYTSVHEVSVGLVKNVSEYAATMGETVKSRVQETPMSFVNQFQDEQEKFSREQRRLKDAAVPPWVGYNEEEQMKAQILELSADSRNVLRNPPPGIQFNFDFAKSYPVAMAMLKEDARLQKLRFDLVPKKVSEEKFWHNFFYRVFLIKQSSQLSSLANDKKDSVSSDRTEGDGDHVVTGEAGEGGESGEVVEVVQSPGHEEFASDALPTLTTEISRETVQAELGQLGVGSGEEEKKKEEEGGRETALCGRSSCNKSCRT
ncbi:Synapse-associated protein 1 [Geodia barretti]|uniref:Synapse-associated protein 1 n=1 Tax=Geodia barretti TaxID=519541 RepID=A0AA35TDU0_GEOBA|nr:Synapse-associated protein 1 [Geodia barretti]